MPVIAGRMLAAVLLACLVLAGCASTESRPGGMGTNGIFKLLQRADRAYAKGHWDDAARFYLHVIENVPNDAHAWLRLGNVHLKLGRYPAAIDAYLNAIAREPDSAKVYFNLSSAYLLEARSVLEKGIEHTSGARQRIMLLRLNELEQLLYGNSR